MVCPNCGSINRDDAHSCKECNIRLTGRHMRPADAAQEKKYLAVGATVGALLLIVLVLIIVSISCTCGGCSNSDEDFVNSNVEGEWSAVEGVSGGDAAGAVSAADAPLEGTQE